MSDSIILNNKGEPFASEAAAAATRKKSELDASTHQIVKYGGGWAIQRPGSPAFATDPVPPETPQAFSRDPVAPTPAGAFSTGGDEPPAPPPAAPPSLEHTFARVIFNPKQSEQEQENAELWLNGKAMCFKRGVEVIVPEPYLEVADQTTRTIFMVRPGQGRRVVARVKSFPYSRIGKASMQEWLAFRSGALASATAAGEAGSV